MKRTLGESYAAAWTAKHSEQALKAEPPDGWPVPPALDGGGIWRPDAAKAGIKAETVIRSSSEYARLGIKVEPGYGLDHQVAGELTSAVTAKIADDYGGGGRKAAAANENNNFSLTDTIKKEAVGDYYGAAAVTAPLSPRLLDPAMERLKARQELLETGKSASRYRSPSRDRSPGYYARSRDGSVDRNRYRSSSREGSREPYRRRSYEGSLGDPYHPRSRDLSPERDRYRDELIDTTGISDVNLDHWFLFLLILF